MSLFGNHKYNKEKKKFDKFKKECLASIDNPDSAKKPKAIKITKKDQKKLLENLLVSDTALETYLTNKKKKTISESGLMSFDLLEESDLLRLDERIKSYKKKKKDEETALRPFLVSFAPLTPFLRGSYRAGGRPRRP